MHYKSITVLYSGTTTHILQIQQQQQKHMIIFLTGRILHAPSQPSGPTTTSAEDNAGE